MNTYSSTIIQLQEELEKERKQHKTALQQFNDFVSRSGDDIVYLKSIIKERENTNEILAKEVERLKNKADGQLKFLTVTATDRDYYKNQSNALREEVERLQSRLQEEHGVLEVQAQTLRAEKYLEALEKIEDIAIFAHRPEADKALVITLYEKIGQILGIIDESLKES